MKKEEKVLPKYERLRTMLTEQCEKNCKALGVLTKHQDLVDALDELEEAQVLVFGRESGRIY